MAENGFNPRMTLAYVGIDTSNSAIIDIIETIDREPDANASTFYHEAGAYSLPGGVNKPGQRLPKAGAYAMAGVGRASAEAGIFSADAKYLHAGAGAHADITGVGVMATAEIASASASAGPLKAKIGLGVDTGARLGIDGAEVKFLGCGASVGAKNSISILGSELSLKFW